MRKGAKSIRVARTAFGAVVGERPPRVTQVIIGLCVVAYLLQILPNSTVTYDYAFVPYLATAEPWRLLTAAFLHSPDSPLHIVLNMYALWITGPYLEAQFGRVRFAALYLISALGGSVGYLFLASPTREGWYAYNVGASGAVFGLFIAYFLVQRHLGRQAGQLLAVIAILFGYSFLQTGVAWQAHLGGVLTGALAAGALVYAPRTNRTLIQFAGLAMVVVLLGLLFIVKIAGVPDNALY